MPSDALDPHMSFGTESHRKTCLRHLGTQNAGLMPSDALDPHMSFGTESHRRSQTHTHTQTPAHTHTHQAWLAL